MEDFFLLIDEAGIIECANASASAAFGYSITELLGQPLSRVVKLPDRASFSSPSQWIRASHAPLLEGIHRSGRLFSLQLTLQESQSLAKTHRLLHFQDPKKEPTTGLIFTRHQELYELATSQGRVSVWEVDYRTNHLEFSPVLANMLGMSTEEIPTTVEGWAKFFHPEDWKMVELQTERMLRRELPEINVECRMLHVDGSILWTLVRGKIFFDEEGKPAKTLGTSIDITDRKKAEQERDLFFTLSLDLLCVADIRGYFRRVNPAFCNTIGYTEEELTSQPFIAYVHPDDLAATNKAMEMLVQGQDVIAFENRYRCADGSWRWLSWTCPAVRHNSETVYGIARDITEAKRVEADLQKAIQEAEKANRAKSEFLSRMSHELRTPLNAILGFGQLLQREPVTPRQSQQLDLIVKGGRHLLKLINEVLDITRIEVGRLDLSPEPVELTELIEEVVSLTQPMAEQHCIGMRIDKPSLEGRWVVAEKQRLKQVLLNLVSNAIKYNVEGGRVLVCGGDMSAERFRISVQDTGPGIPPDKQHRLFAPFDRLGAETSSVEGSGLGLALSKRLVEIMGGTLTFESEVGKGTKFTIELAKHTGPTQAPEAVQPPAAPARLAGPTRTLLYIEDNLANVQLIEAVLVYRPGIRLLTALQGGVGLELARQHRPNLILLDVHLPDIMGYDLLGSLRADLRTRSIPVVVISADATSPQIERLLTAGAKEYLTKPIDVEHFLRILDHYLQEV